MGYKPVYGNKPKLSETTNTELDDGEGRVGVQSSLLTSLPRQNTAPRGSGRLCPFRALLWFSRLAGCVGSFLGLGKFVKLIHFLHFPSAKRLLFQAGGRILKLTQAHHFVESHAQPDQGSVEGRLIEGSESHKDLPLL